MSDTGERHAALWARARTLQAQRQYAEAAACYQEAIRLAPRQAEYVLSYAQLAEEVRDWGAAAKLYRVLGTLRPDCGFEGKLAQALCACGRFDEALPWLQQAHRKRPADADILVNLGAAFAGAERPAEATVAFRAAMERRDDVEILRRLLAVQINAGGDGADETVREGLARFPDSDAFRTMAAEHLLKRGRYGEGFDLFQRGRFHAADQQPGADVACEAWNGEPLDGPLLVIAEQGLGDEILASSLYDELVSRGVQATIECDPRLLPVFARSFPALSFVARGQGDLARAARERPGARKIRAIDICRLFRRDRNAFPVRRAWLLADATQSATLRDEYRARWPGMRIAGISWKSMRLFASGDVKSLRLTDLRRTLATAGTVFMNLQYGDCRRDLAEAAAAGLSIETDARIDPTQDIDALFAQVAALDAVVTTSNTTAHIAGAQGIPCLVALPSGKGVPWYWGYAGSDTPWYPSLRLFRNRGQSTLPALDAALADALAGLPGSAVPR